MATSITTTEAARHLGDVLARVKHKGEHFLFTKNQQPVARLVPASKTRLATGADILKALKQLPCDPGFAGDLERVGQADRIPENPWD